MNSQQHGKLNRFQKDIDIDKVYVKGALPESDQGICAVEELRMLTWNVERGYHPQQIAGLLNSIRPDIACLQELDWNNQRTHNIDLLDFLAAATGLTGYFGVEFYEIDTSSRSPDLAGGGVHGNALLSRYRPKWVERVELPQQFDWQSPPAWARAIARREERIGGRFALCAGFELEHGSHELTVCSVHLEDKDGGVEGRIAQFQHLLQVLPRQGSGSQLIIGGDLNTLDNWVTRILTLGRTTQSGGKPWYVPECRWWKERVLPSTGLSDPFPCSNTTYERALIYREKLDWILLSDELQVLERGVEDYHGSDHRPLWVDIVLASEDHREP